MVRVLCTCPPMAKAIDHLKDDFAQRNWEVYCPPIVQTLSVDALKEIVVDFDVWIAGDDPVVGEVLRAGKAGKLSAVVKWGVGIDNVNFAEAEAEGFRVLNTPGAFGAEVADVGMAYVLTLARDLMLIDRGIRSGEWPKPAGISLTGRKLGVVGFGDIGKSVVHRAAAFGFDIVAFDPRFDSSSELPVREGQWPTDLQNLDFLVFTCALTSSNRHMLNAETLAMLKPGVRIVNVARGPLIDESALIEALKSGHVHSAALDVFEEEPLPLDSYLREHPRCILGSHNGSNTVDAVIRTSKRALDLAAELLNE